MFIDSSMVLHEDFLLEFMIRHERAQGIALLGFKENVTWNRFAKMRDRVRAGSVKPDYREDWKYRHTLGPIEGGFRYRGHWYEEGSEIWYMALTSWLKQLSGTEQIGYRSLPTFFQTNIASAPREVLLDSGGFDVAFDDTLWGLEDSFIGALLVARGIKLVPCPSALAFKIEHPEDETKWFDLERHRRLYSELLMRPVAEFRKQRLRDLIESLQADGTLIE